MRYGPQLPAVRSDVFVPILLGHPGRLIGSYPAILVPVTVSVAKQNGMIRTRVTCRMDDYRNPLWNATDIEPSFEVIWLIILKDSPTLVGAHILPCSLPVTMLSPIFVRGDLCMLRGEFAFNRDPIIGTVITPWSDKDTLIHDLRHGVRPLLVWQPRSL